MWLLKQSIISAFRELKADKLRTLLSLGGVSVGIFSIVAVITVVDSLQSVLIDSFESFGSDVIMIEQIPLEPDLNEDGFFKWWEYVSRPQVSYPEYMILASDDMVGNIAFCRYSSSTTTYRGREYKDGDVVGADGNWLLALRGELVCGRGFTDSELSSGDAVTVIGNYVAKELFDTPQNALGKDITLGTQRARVIGVFDEMGTSEMSLTDIDAVKVVPYRFSLSINPSFDRNSIIVSSSDGLSKDEFEIYLRHKMRIIRELENDDDDNFALNRVSFLEEEVSEIFKLVNLVGWIVGCFSLLIGCFGIANIMFVAVYERIPQIGIMKALGAGRNVILSQFLIESAMLSLLGAAAGICAVQIGVVVANLIAGQSILTLSLDNLIIGCLTALVTGLAAGCLPAHKAAILQPSVAITSVK